VKPRSQLQAVEPGQSLEEPGGQGAHDTAPGAGLNLPGSQFWQGAPSVECWPAAQGSHVAPDRPGLHTHAVLSLLPAGEFVLGGHLIQTCLLDAE